MLDFIKNLDPIVSFFIAVGTVLCGLIAGIVSFRVNKIKMDNLDKVVEKIQDSLREAEESILDLRSSQRWNDERIKRMEQVEEKISKALEQTGLALSTLMESSRSVEKRLDAMDSRTQVQKMMSDAQIEKIAASLEKKMKAKKRGSAQQNSRSA